jgi:hypothetical protein
MFMLTFLASVLRGHAQAIVRRGGPVQFQLGVRIFEPQSRRTRSLLAGRQALTDCGMMKECP